MDDTFIIIPLTYKTLKRCLYELLNAPERMMFQSELKKLVYSKSWRTVVKPQMELMNQLIKKYFPEFCLVVMTPMRNPKTGKRNEVLFQIHPSLDVWLNESHLLIRIKPTEAIKNEARKKEHSREEAESHPINAGKARDNNKVLERIGKQAKVPVGTEEDCAL